MKKHIFLAATAVLLALSSCNLTKSSATRVSGAEGTTASSTTKTNKKQNTTNKTSKTSGSITAPTAEQLSGEWTIVSVNGKTVGEREEMPYLAFDNGRLYGNNGCNVLNGSYSLADGKITFKQIATTMRFCPDADFEHEINLALKEGSPVAIGIESLGHESYITLYGAGGHKMLTARRHNMGFLNGQWRVTSINGTAIDDEECNIFFDVAEGKVHGNTGCNYFNGSLFISPDRSNAIEMSNMGVTRMACPKTQQETAMLVALEETASAIQGAEGRVMLLDKNGKQLITLLRSNSLPTHNNNSHQ